MTKPEDPSRVLIFDTSLRDGEQAPGISLNAQEKLEIAQQLARLGVDVIEAGFPITSPGDFEAVRGIARTVQGPVICLTPRCSGKFPPGEPGSLAGWRKTTKSDPLAGSSRGIVVRP